MSDLTDEEFVDLFRRLGPAQFSKQIGRDLRWIYRRRSQIEQKLGCPVDGPVINPNAVRAKIYPQRAQLEVSEGVVVIASDAHYWPGPPSLMHRALVATIKEFKPKAVILNGDVIDAPQISRHPPIGWASMPDLADEIENAQERTFEIEKAAGKARKIWSLGNHDARFETKIATVAPQYARVHGVSLTDHFPLWEPCWSTWVNSELVVKHRFKGGIHAPFNNTLWAGKSMVTGHLHSAKVVPLTDYNGTRYGVDTGCIAETDHKAFVDYTEDNPKNWRSAFGVFTFKEGRLMQPELVLKWNDEKVQFRGWIGAP